MLSRGTGPLDSCLTNQNSGRTPREFEALPQSVPPKLPTLAKRAEETSSFVVFLSQPHDESFLKYNVLVIILIQESSGSIRHELESVTTDDDSVIFGIKRIIPEMGTTDMAQWHILISIPSVSYNDEDIKVIFN